MTGKLWVGDVGDLTIEEIDIVTSGGNYAWPHCEGTLPNGCEQAGDVDPIFTYPHSGGSSLGTCVIGGAFAGSGFGGFDHDYFFGDCTSSKHLPRGTERHARRSSARPTLFVDAGDTPSDIDLRSGRRALLRRGQRGEVRRVAPTSAGGDQPVAGTKLTLKDNAQPGEEVAHGAGEGRHRARRLRRRSDVAGGTLRVSRAPPSTTRYPLPAGNWEPHRRSRRPQGLQVQGQAPRGGSGEERAGEDRQARSRPAARARRWATRSATNPDPVTVVLTIGGRRYCATFGGTVKFTADQVVLREARAGPGQLPVGGGPVEARPWAEVTAGARLRPCRVSERDQEYMRRIGEAKAASHADAAASHRALALPSASGVAGPSTWPPATIRREDRDEDPRPFYERARALGLYRPEYPGLRRSHERPGGTDRAPGLVRLAALGVLLAAMASGLHRRAAVDEARSTATPTARRATPIDSPARRARISASTRTTPSTGTRGATRPSRGRAPRTGPSSSASATPRVTGVT